MRRDFELLREMVLMIESKENDGWMPEQFKISGYTQEQIDYHTYLLVDAGFANGEDVTQAGHNVPEYYINRLTWAGHEFANAARDEARWKEAMGYVKKKGEGITISVLTQLLISLMKKTFGL